jgi:hypothetical protein
MIIFLILVKLYSDKLKIQNIFHSKDMHLF